MPRRTSQQLTEDYIGWLESQLRDEHGRPTKSYSELVSKLAAAPFTAIVPMDENRMQDGLDLRTEFAHKIGISPARMYELGPCSFLEVLIALSRLLEFNAGGKAPGWAWQLVCNLELDRMWDPLTRAKERKIQEVIDTVVSRKYAPDGTGGFFPLAFPDDDQTRIELWYQLNSYIEELHPEH